MWFHTDFCYVKFLHSQEYCINRVIAKAVGIATVFVLLHGSHFEVFSLLISRIL